MRFTQVLINLIKNSMKFCTKRGDSIHVISAFEHDTMTVAVIDTGKGIQAHEKKKLFHLFGKLKSTADVNQQGSGMGLLICKRLVEANHGTIEIHSDGKDKGCTIRFTMRMHEPTTEQIEQARNVDHRDDESLM